MTVTESVFLAPGEVLDTAGVDLPLSIMHNFKQELASRGLFFCRVQSVKNGSMAAGTCLHGRRCIGVEKIRERLIAYYF